ncbi:hypothetical protein CO614_02890 [Lysobacteraceae bacterium NML120232]|nr:hypothetical protein CO614_02890 [Xanthomonadaceae bacterium NML120232]
MMTRIELLAWLQYATVISSAAIVLILLLRKPVRRRFGTQVAYALWWWLPLSLLGSLLPARKMAMPEMPLAGLGVFVTGHEAASPLPQSTEHATAFLALWLLGMLLMAVWLTWQQSRFLHGLGRLQRRADGVWQAETRVGLPALIGVFRPRIILPVDFETRYDPHERHLMLLHENAHRHSFDMPGNALAAVLRVLFWFNPLLHFAVARFRHDQELACDARVLQQQPGARRAYAGAMLKTHIASVSLPVGCHWGSSHPLKERVMQMQRKLPQNSLQVAGLGVAISLALASGFAAWAMQPAASQVASSTQNDYSAEIQLGLNGQKAHSFRLSEGYGRQFAIKTDAGDLSFSGQINPVRMGETLAFRIDGKIWQQGQASAAPVTLVLAAGKTGTLRTGSNADSLVLSASVTPRDRQAAWAQAEELNLQAAQGSDVVHRVIKRPTPIYPPEALKAGIEGKVRVLVDINADGTLKHAKMGSSEPVGVFDAAVMSAMSEVRFQPQGAETSGYIDFAFVQDK